MRIVDISRPLRRGIEIECEVPAELPVYEGHPCEEYRFRFESHRGCYFETSAHLFRGATMTSGVPVEKLFMPALVARLEAAREGAIGPEEVSEALAGCLRRGDGLIVDTGGRQNGYFVREFGSWLAEEGVALLGATLERYDTGFVNPTGVFVELFRAEIPIIAEIHNLEEIRHERVFLVVLPTGIESVSCVPCRAVVLDGEREEIDLLVRLLRPELAGRLGRGALPPRTPPSARPT